MELRVLGALEVVDGDGPVPSRLRRSTAGCSASLVVANSRTLSADELIDAVWGETPPASARKLLQVYVSQLRKVLPDSARDPHAAARLRARAPREAPRRRHASSGCTAEAAARPRAPATRRSPPRSPSEALALWRGRAYARRRVRRLRPPEASGSRSFGSSPRSSAYARRARGRTGRRRHGRGARARGGAPASRVAAGARHALRSTARVASRRRSSSMRRPGPAFGTSSASSRAPKLRALQRRILEQSPDLELESRRGGALHALPESPTALVGRGEELVGLRALLRGGDTPRHAHRRRRQRQDPSRARGRARAGVVVRERRRLRGARARWGTRLSSCRRSPHTLGVARCRGSPCSSRSWASLQPRELLLVLDNAEHVRDAAPAFVELLRRAPRPRCSVTSRAVLHVSGERV